MEKYAILSCLKYGDFTFHSGGKSKYLFDVMELVRNYDFLEDFHEFVNGDFIVGIDFGGAILTAINGGMQNIDFAVIRKDGTIYGSPIPENYVLLDDVVTTENSMRTAMKQLSEKIGIYPDEIKCVVDRRDEDKKFLHIESMLEITEEQLKDIKIRNKIQELRDQLPEVHKCSLCPNPLFEYLVSADAEPHRICGKPVCKKCYYDALGKEIEKHPIGFVPPRLL